MLLHKVVLTIRGMLISFIVENSSFPSDELVNYNITDPCLYAARMQGHLALIIDRFLLVREKRTFYKKSGWDLFGRPFN